MYTSAPLAEFDEQGDIDLIHFNRRTSFSKINCQCILIRYILHQISLIIFVTIYLICGGMFFAYVESDYYSKKDDERKEIIHETYENIRLYANQLLNEQLNESFENAYQEWRWKTTKSSNLILLNKERIFLLDNRTEFELEKLTQRLAIQQLHVDKFVYKWTYSTAILYAATLVTTIGYGNISPKTDLGKISTVIYALIGILLVVSWLKLVGDSLALLVIRCHQCLEEYIKGKKLSIHQSYKVSFWVPISFLLLYLVAGSILFASWEGWSYIDAAYFSFITFTTIGFGDFVPGESTISDQHGRSILCSMYLLFGVLITAMSFRLIQQDIDRIKTNLLQRLGIDHVHLPIIKR